MIFGILYHIVGILALVVAAIVVYKIYLASDTGKQGIPRLS